MKKTLYVFVWACSALLALPALPAAAQVPGYVPTDGLVGWWPFNGNANDESGNGNDGTVNGATLTEDRFGNANAAYDFDGVDDFIVTDTITFSNYGDYSISLWANISVPYSPGFPQHYLLANAAVENGVYLNTDFDENQFACNSTYSSNSIGTWHHYLGVKQDGVFTLYIDNINVGSTEGCTTTSNFINGHPIYFGNSSIFTEYTNGQIDDIAIYNRALTEQEIQALYTGQCPSVTTNCTSLPSNLQQGLVGYWPFCGNANDESGNGNDGTVNGATLTEDRFGNAGSAYNFDGMDDIISVPFQTTQMDENYSISTWIQPSDYSSPYPQILWSNSNNGASNEYSFRMQLDSISQSLMYWMEIGASNTGQIISSDSQQIAEGNNYHIAITTNAESTLLYINNNLVQTTQRISLSTLSDSIFIGHYGDFFGYNGVIDDIGIWNRALTPEEVQELYTLDACTFTVYDTLTVYETVYDTLYTYETIYDTVTTYVTVTDTLLIDITFTGIEGQPSWLNTVTVFPNPASDHITIDYGNFALLAGYNTIITDAAGATVYSSAVNSQQAYIDINAWGATGVYYLTIYDAGGAPVAVRHIVLE
jgi:hypothetical protein